MSTVHEQLTAVSLKYKNVILRGSPVFARDLMIPSRPTAPGFSQDDRQTEKDNHEPALSLFMSCRSFTQACTLDATEGERLPL